VNALADTSVLVDYLREVEAARQLIRPVLAAGDVVAGSVHTRLELLIGARRSERRRTDALLAAIRWLPVDEQVAEQADLLAHRYGWSHSGIDAVDYCVAATAQVHGLELWALNVRHFPMVPGLRSPW